MSQQVKKEKNRGGLSRVRRVDAALEKLVKDQLINIGINSFKIKDKSVYGKPSISFKARKLAVFCHGDFWHGYNYDADACFFRKNELFWSEEIPQKIGQDKEITETLENQGWRVLRLWEHEIKDDIENCINRILYYLRQMPPPPYRMIDLCAGIGGIRRGFELTGQFENVLSAEIDKYACRTYMHIFGNDPQNDLTSEEFKNQAETIGCDILLAGFPCQTFSRVGREEGFENEEKGQIFFHIADILERTRPFAFFLENVDRLVTHDNGETFRRIIETLVSELNYHVIGVNVLEDGTLSYSPKAFVRNSRDFGIPQNRPRTYLVGFDRERFTHEAILELPTELPKSREQDLYDDLNSLLEHNVDPKYYMASGYLDTLIRHRERQEGKGYGFGYRIVNEIGIEKPVANALLATGGSGKERNLIYDPQEGIAGMKITGKKTPLNDRGIRMMTPVEWGKLQGFINYAFLSDTGEERFSFPPNMPDAQKYKQFGNSVTIPVIEEMAHFILRCVDLLVQN